MFGVSIKRKLFKCSFFKNVISIQIELGIPYPIVLFTYTMASKG